VEEGIRVYMDVRERALEKEFEEEYFREACLGECAPSTFRVVAVLDANGDGMMEVVTATP